MIKEAFLKRIVVKGSTSLSQIDAKLANKHDFLVLNKETISLGRSKHCDLVLKPKIISRKHVLFQFIDGQWSLKCLNDKNGVFINGKLLKLNQVKRLEDNYIISLGPTFQTDYIYQFTTKQDHMSRQSKSDQVPLDLTTSNKQLSISSYLENSSQPKTVNSFISFSSNNESRQQRTVLIDEKMNGACSTTLVNEDQLRSNARKIKELKVRVKYLEDKLTDYKERRKETRVRFKRMSNKLKQLQKTNLSQKQSLRNKKLSLNRERLKKKELIKKLQRQERSKDTSNNGALSDDNKIVQKYNELFTDDLMCGVCLELYESPVTSTCGHSFCNFCLNQWLKRKNSRGFDCPLCRTSCKGFFKNLVIENIIEKYLNSTDNKQILATRSRLVEERNKVLEESNKDENHNRRIRQLYLNSNVFHGSLIDVLRDEHRLFDAFQDDFSSNDEDDLSHDIDFEDFDEYGVSGEEEPELDDSQFDVVIND